MEDDYYIPEAALDVMIFDDEPEAEVQNAPETPPAEAQAHAPEDAGERAETDDDLSFMEEDSDLIDFGDDDTAPTPERRLIVPAPQTSFEQDWDRAISSIQV